MLSQQSWLLYVLSAVVCAGCGRIGVELLTEQQLLPDAAVPGLDASLFELGDAGVDQPDAAPVVMDADVSQLDIALGFMDADVAQPDGAPAAMDAGVVQPDAAPVAVDAGVADTSPGRDASSGAGDTGSATDATVADAAPDTSVPAPACQLAVGGATVGYQTGELGTLEGMHLFSLVQTGLCAAPSGCDRASGTDLVQESCSVSTCQMWESLDAGGGWSFLRNPKSGLCMYISDTANGTRAVDWECFTSDRMLWQVACAGNDMWYLINKFSGKALQGAGSSSAGTGIIQSAQAGTPQQRWTITSNPSAYTVIMSSAESDPNAVWRYTTSSPGSTWTRSSFDDSRWSTGPGAFGDQSRSFGPVRTAWTTRDIWLRRTFALSSIPASLTVKVFHDEGVDVFINGVSVASISVWSNAYEAIDLPSSAQNSLVVGSNTIAVHCQNSAAPQYIDVGLVSYTWQ